ncbi:MAG: hypothetical protein Q7K57_56630 [Burkholderiaceae bacterium]|nr:hypothetical protein [Burkholderiaceae bacterium]
MNAKYKNIKVQISFVNGDSSEWDENEEFVDHLVELQKCGLTGKELVNTLITDDWGPPPRNITISWTNPDGVAFDVNIYYE